MPAGGTTAPQAVRRGEGDPPDEGGPPDEGPDPDPASAAPRSPFRQAACRSAADPDQPDPPPRDPPRPRRASRRGTRPRHPRPRPGPLPWPPPSTPAPTPPSASPSPTHPGIAIGHGCAKSGRPGIRGLLSGTAHAAGRAPGPDQPHHHHRPPGAATRPTGYRAAGITRTTRKTRGQTAGALARRNSDLPAGSDPRARSTTPARRSQGTPGDPDWCGSWTLTLPTGLQYTREPGAGARPMTATTGNESHAYKPNETLRHLVQIRDHTCTFPPCSRHARDSDSSTQPPSTRAEEPARATPEPGAANATGSSSHPAGPSPSPDPAGPMANPTWPPLHPRPQALPV